MLTLFYEPGAYHKRVVHFRNVANLKQRESRKKLSFTKVALKNGCLLVIVVFVIVTGKTDTFRTVATV